MTTRKINESAAAFVIFMWFVSLVLAICSVFNAIKGQFDLATYLMFTGWFSFYVGKMVGEVKLGD